MICYFTGYDRGANYLLSTNPNSKGHQISLKNLIKRLFTKEKIKIEQDNGLAADTILRSENI